MSAPAPANQERPAQAGRAPRDLVVGLVILALCALVYWLTLGFREAPPALAQNVQPATFPRMVVGVIAALAVLMIVLGLGHKARQRRVPPPLVAGTALAMLAFVLAFQWLGIVAAMVLFCLAMPFAWGERRWPAILAFGLGFPALVWLIFAVGLDVHFDDSPLTRLVTG